MLSIAESGLAFMAEELGFLEVLWSSVLLVAAYIASRWKRGRVLVTSSTRVAIELYNLGRTIHPEPTLDNFKCRVQILGLWFNSLQSLRAWYDRAHNPRLDAALQIWPRIQGAIAWPYISSHWSMEQRLGVIDQHYRVAAECAPIVSLAAEREVELVRLDEQYPGLRLVLDKANWYIREGEVVLNLFLQDKRLMAIAFTLGREGDQRVAYVGALQGAHSSESLDALALYREITHALHGLRPRDFLVVALKFLCKALGVSKIYAVSDDARHHRHKYFGTSKQSQLFLNYDQVWTENGGDRRDDGFFSLPVVVKYRDKSEISTNKRALYRRRYQLLDQVDQAIKATCAAH